MARQRRDAAPRARQHASQRVHGAMVLASAARRAACAAIVAALNARLHDGFGIGHATIQTELADGDGCRADPALLCGTMEAHGHSHAGCGH